MLALSYEELQVLDKKLELVEKIKARMRTVGIGLAA